MNTFKFDKKTGRFETLSIGFLDADCLSILKTIAEHGYGNDQVYEARFPLPEGADREDQWQRFHSASFNLKDLGLTIWERDKIDTSFVDANDYNKSEKGSGDFLTYLGTAFCESIGIKKKSFY